MDLIEKPHLLYHKSKLQLVCFVIYISVSIHYLNTMCLLIKTKYFQMFLIFVLNYMYYH